jgi:uncharacterized protein
MTATAGMSGGSAGSWYRVHGLTVSSLTSTAAADYAAILPAVLDALRHRRSFIAGWLSRGDGGPLELVTNAGLPSPCSPGGPAATEGSAPDTAAHRPSDAAVVEMLFPWGARGTLIDGNMIDELDRLVWAPCPGRRVPIEADSRQRTCSASEAGRPSLFESALHTLIGRPFGWLIVADPTDLLDAETADLRNELTVLRRYEDDAASFEAGRAEQRLAELDQFREAGLWQVRVLVGARSEQELELIAPVLVGSTDLSAHPYRLRCPAGAHEFADVLAVKLTDTSDDSSVPFAATAGALTALTGLPRREVPGVRLLPESVFGVNAAAPARTPAVELGRILDGRDREVGTFAVPLATLRRPVLVTGATGSGTSQTVGNLLGQLTTAGTSWLAIGHLRSERAALVTRLAEISDAADGERRPGVVLINPADPDAVPLSVNPLAPEPGYPVHGHIDLVRALFLAAFDAREPFAEILSQALHRVYADCGWGPRPGGATDQETPPAVPTLARLQAAAHTVIADAGYGRAVQADMRGAFDALVGSVRAGPTDRFLEGGHPADVGALLGSNVVVALDDVAGDVDKALIIGAFIIRIAEHLRLQSAAGGPGGRPPAGTAAADELRHVVVLEEAHRLLRAGRQGATASAVELLASLLAEAGGYGEGIVVTEQIPAKLVPDVIKNAALTVLHRLPAADDRQLVGAVMNLDERQSRQVVSLPPGEAVVFTDGMDRPVRVRVPFAGDGERRTEASPEPADAAPAGQIAAGLVPADSSLLSGRRSPACGPACVTVRPCTLAEIRAAEPVARTPQDAWLRVWAEVYVLAHLVNRPRPRVPVGLRRRWAELPERLRDCALATALDDAVQRRSHVLRQSYDPAGLSVACAASGAGMLTGGKGAGTMPGTGWVIPQLQWLHELERVCPLDGPPPDPFGVAPPLDYALPGLPGEAGAKIGQRVSGLRRHPLSMEVTANRLIAWTALLGEDDHSAFIENLAAVAIGVSHRGQLRMAAGEMGVTGWLEAVLSWPRRFIVGADDQALSPVREPDRVAG